MFGRNNDAAYVGVAPGVIPPAGEGHVERIKGHAEWSGDPAVRFEPPTGVSPVLAGTVIDGSVDPHDIGAMMIDLSLRGWFRIEKEGEDAWVFVKSEQNPDNELTVAEAMFMNALFPAGVDRASLPELKARLRGPLKQITDALYRTMTDRGWYERDPRDKGPLGIGGRAPRTADGTAIRVQTLGFRKYLATAEAKQIKFEEAAGLFSRYLPYAMAFGLAKHWASVIGDVAKQAQLDGFGDILGGVAGDPFFWMLYGNGIAELSIDAISGLTDLLSDAGGLFDLGDVVGGLGDVFDSIGDALGDIGDLFN